MPRDGRGPRGLYWCWTLNNYTPAECAHLTSGLAEAPEVRYLIFGREVGESGTPHLQGYLELRSRLFRSGVVRLLGLRVHAELRRGSAEQAIQYCCKSDPSPVSFGTPPDPEQSSGRRTDLEAVRARLLEGSTEAAIADEHFAIWCLHRKAFREYKRLKASNGRRGDLRVYLLWGASGAGKTHYAYTRYPALFRCPSPDLSWWDGYDGQDTVLVDDYRGDAKESTVLQLLDKYPVQVPVKGGFVPFAPTVIIISSNIPPTGIHNFPNADSRAAWKRRFSATLRYAPVVGDAWVPLEEIDAKLVAGQDDWE